MEQMKNGSRPKHTGCGNVFSRKKALEATHRKKFPCKLCDRSFRFPSLLLRHQIVHMHSEHKEFKCTFCKFATNRKSSLTKHIKEHELKNNHSSSSQLTDKLVVRGKTSIKTTLSGRSTHGAKKDVRTRSICRLFSSPPNRENLRLDVKKLSEGFNAKIKVEKESEDQEPAEIQIRNAVLKQDSHCNLRQKNSSDFVDMKMRSGATRPVSSIVGIERPVLTTPSHWLNSIHEEARQLRSQISLSATLSTVLSQLERLLELSASIMIEICGSVGVEVRSQAIECFDYVWCASKIAIGRWEDIEGSKESNSFLKAVIYAYTTLPIFIKWEKSEHLEIVGHIILLAINTVKNCLLQLSSIQSVTKKEPMTSVQKTVNIPSWSSNSTRTAEEMTNQKMNVVTPSIAKEIIKKENAPLVQLSEEKHLSATLEFCRLANIATWLNTKERSTSGFKDDSDVYHPMYRYEIGKMLNLYCPAHVTHLKCCGKVFGLLGLKAHVSENHEAGRPNRTEPSITPV